MGVLFSEAHLVVTHDDDLSVTVAPDGQRFIRLSGAEGNNAVAISISAERVRPVIRRMLRAMHQIELERLCPQRAAERRANNG
ncbi:MAG TPA: hypothetical protein GXX28_06145 [Firmicutes bacterium]|nr:hypothetical protein [Bacillota bacterium]